MAESGSALIRSVDCPSTAWKNDGGQTQQLLCWPSDAAMTDFRWRISVAQIDRDGPFSTFPGASRTLVLLHGVGMDLAFADRTIRLDERNRRIDFDGEENLDCRLIDGQTLDLNLIWDRRAGTAQLDTLTIDGDWTASADHGQLLGLYLLHGEVQTEHGLMQRGDLLWGSSLAASGAATALQLRLPR